MRVQAGDYILKRQIPCGSFLRGICLCIIAQKDEIHKKEVEERVQEYQASKPHKECPVCHSSSISKISNVGKVVKVGVFGILGAGDLGKTWKCEACGCKF